MKTVAHTEIHSWWNGLVKIDEIKEYTDDRGSLVELWRSDDEITDSKMSYWSITKPFILRGPHQHSVAQTDFFVTWKARMVYQLYNPDTKEMKCYITNPDKVTRVKVAPPIVHSYRNLEARDVLTGNFPSSLFMGENKSGPIDEIRHEQLIKPTKTIWIFGANGRLGKALIKNLYNEMGYHTYNVVPVYEKFSNDRDGLEKLRLLFDHIIKNNTPEQDVILNCIANTSVQEQSHEFTFPNYLLPKYITEFAIKNKIHMIQFSTDYVFQQGVVSEYTKSKVLYEKWVQKTIDELSTNLDDTDKKQFLKYIHIIRLANLFSQDENDTQNILTKLVQNIKNTQQITISKDLVVMPTDVECIAEHLTKNYINNISSFEPIINLSGRIHKIENIIHNYVKNPENVKIIYNENPMVINSPEMFYNDKTYIELDCSRQIKEKFISLNKLLS
jgi:dTDP-4-dehydrorhamnose reductase/dTDP-4-dehydrorhamnose 3,5-epimerase-like enzyme